MNVFAECLASSHAAEDWPVWKEIYSKAFPGMVGMANHRADGQHQRYGIDRSIVLASGKRLWVDEKVRLKNKVTGRVYDDIALEVWSDEKRRKEGWVVKPLLADYIAYAIMPLGVCYLLPVVQLQDAWRRNASAWLGRFNIIRAKNPGYVTVSCCVPPVVLFPELGKQLRVSFEPLQEEPSMEACPA